MADPQIFTLPDGRKMEYAISGSLQPNALSLIWIHGTPGSCLPIPGLIPACRSANVRLITFARAGYRTSSRNRGRIVVDNVPDVKALKTHLGIEQCVVGGWSGGGPIALACAARLDGCRAALCVAGVAPWDASGLDWLEGQGEDNIEELHAALAGEAASFALLSAQRPEMLQADAAGLIELMSRLLPEADRKAMRDAPEYGQHLVDAIQDGLRDGVDGWVDDNLAFIQPWGFDLGEIKVPVLVRQGKEDRMVPVGHGRWLVEHLGESVVTGEVVEGEGHVSVFLGQEGRMVEWLVRMVGR